MTGIAATVVAALVFGYDARLKRLGVVGPVVMGSCRAGSVLIGASLCWGRPTLLFLRDCLSGRGLGTLGLDSFSGPLLVAMIAWGYTTVVSLLARGEASGKRPGLAAYVPGLFWLGAIASLVLLSHLTRGDWSAAVSLFGMTHWAFWAILLVICAGACLPGAIWLAAIVWILLVPFWDSSVCVTLKGRVFWAGWERGYALITPALLGSRAAWAVRCAKLPVPAFIGRLIRAMIPMQAAWCLLSLGPLGSATAAAVIAGFLLLWVGAVLSARRFYGS